MSTKDQGDRNGDSSKVDGRGARLPCSWWVLAPPTCLAWTAPPPTAAAKGTFSEKWHSRVQEMPIITAGVDLYTHIIFGKKQNNKNHRSF